MLCVSIASPCITAAREQRPRVGMAAVVPERHASDMTRPVNSEIPALRSVTVGWRQTAEHHSGRRLPSSEMQRLDQGKHWVVGAEGEWAHGGLPGQPQPVAAGKSAGVMHQYPTLLRRPIAWPARVSRPDASHGRVTPASFTSLLLLLHTPPEPTTQL
jgi:hypothetical protein